MPSGRFEVPGFQGNPHTSLGIMQRAGRLGVIPGHLPDPAFDLLDMSIDVVEDRKVGP